MRQASDAFPAGLYGMLLLAAFGLALPSLFAPAERVLVGAAALVPRTVGAWCGEPAAAADRGAEAALAELRRDLDARVQVHDVGGAAAYVPAGFTSLVCTVVAAEGRGGGGRPSQLRLDRTYRELEGFADFATKGPALVGFLLRAGQGLASKDGPDDLARVLLINDPKSRRVASAMALDGGGSLRMVVGAAARVDPAPLRAELWDDPYRASTLQGGGRRVLTMELPDLDGEPPPGLVLGATKVWGYRPDPVDDPITIGVFVEPPYDPRALSHVVLWRKASDGTDPAPVQSVAEHAATLWSLPGAPARYLIAADTAVPDGAAVIQDGACIGQARGLAFGLGLVTAFGRTRRPWSLILLPDDPALAPRELLGEVVDGDDAQATLRCSFDALGGGGAAVPDGSLFTGGNGRSCPPGLFVGRARAAVGELGVLAVTLPGPREAEAVTVLVAGEQR